MNIHLRKFSNVIKAPENGWRWSEESVKEKIATGEIIFKKDYSGIIRKIYLCDQEGRTPENLWEGPRFGTTRTAAAVIKDLFNGKQVFDTPKPHELIMRMMEIATKKDSIVIDFFSGSATTAHAVMQLNADDGGSRRYILVQLSEETDEKSEAYKAGYKNICEIGKERIRRAGKKIKQDSPLTTQDLDIGFRVFKCADSNMKDVYYTPADYSQQMLFDLEDNIKEDRNDLDLLFGCMLDWGVTLDLPLRTEKVDGVTIHIVNEGDLVACFDQNIPETAIDHIASLLPMRVVLRDNCFKEAKEKMNFFEIFKQRTGWSEEEVRKNVKVI